MTETVSPKQRSPWVYVLAGCGLFAAVSCLGFVGAGLYCGKQLKDIGDAVNDPAKRQEVAVKMLGTIPEGYQVVAAVSMFGLTDLVVLSDQPPLPDGGLVVGGRLFRFMHMMANPVREQLKAAMTQEPFDRAALAKAGVQLTADQIVKRGTLTVDKRSVQYLVAEGEVEIGGGPAANFNSALSALLFFECPGKAMDIAVWSQAEALVDANDLTGSVGDEAELSRFIKPLDPCKR